MVIAIIALLVALLLPALNRSKQKAHNVVCLNNQRQICLDFRIRLEDDLNNPRLDRADVAEWYTGQVGKSPGWVCPAAPVKGSLPPLSPWSWFGKVDSAWWWPDFWLRWRAGGAPDVPTTIETRVGSYAVNEWLLGKALDSRYRAFGGFDQPWDSMFFVNEGQIAQPMLTPLLADSVAPDSLLPLESDHPAKDLVRGLPTDLTHTPGAVYNSMPYMNIPRHGDRPARVPTYWPESSPLPGAVNVGFFDGHVETVKLDRLWQLYWHVDYQPPPKRPGLQ